MARQTGTILISGTIDHLTFYVMNGKGFVRKKSRLDKKQFYRRPNFSNSRRASGRFGNASKLASSVYRQLPKDERAMELFRELIPIATHMLKYQHSPEEVLTALQAHIDLRKRKEQLKKEVLYKKPAQLAPTHATRTNASKDKSKRAIRKLRRNVPPSNPLQHNMGREAPKDAT